MYCEDDIIACWAKLLYLKEGIDKTMPRGEQPMVEWAMMNMNRAQALL